MHKDIVEYYNRDNCQTIMHVGANYSNKIMKRFKGLGVEGVKKRSN